MSCTVLWTLPFASLHPRPHTPAQAARTSRTTINASLIQGRGLATLLIGILLILLHLGLLLAAPSWIDFAVYPIMGFAVFLCAAAFYLHGRAAAASGSLRWTLFASALAVHGLNLIRAGLGSQFGPSLGPYIGNSFNTLDAILQASTSTLFILALTLPSGVRTVPERLLDITVAATFSAIRTVDFATIINAVNPTHNLLLRFSFENGIYLLLTLIALGASSREDLPFFKAAIIYRAGSLISVVCTNHLGFQWLHNDHANPWALSATVLRVATALYLLNGLPVPTEMPVSPAQKIVIRSIVPFTMSCLLVWVATVVLPHYPALGVSGITLGVVAFLTRTALSSLGRSTSTTQNPVKTVPTPLAPLDPLNSVENRAGFHRALEAHRPTVSPASPISVILFGIESTSDQTESGFSDEDTDLVSMGRTLSQWQAPGRLICYMGNARFAMVLPATSHPVALALSERICLTLEALRPPGTSPRILVDAGVAQAVRPEYTTELLALATNALIRAQMRRHEHPRLPSSISKYPTDA